MSQQAQATPNQKLTNLIGGNTSSIPGLPSPIITEKQILPTINYPRKSLNLSLPQNYHAYKSQSESPFAMRNKSNTQKSYINNNSIKLDKIEETQQTNSKNKIAYRQNRSISPSFNEKSQIKNTLNVSNLRNGNKIARQQTAGDTTLKNPNASNQAQRLKVQTLQSDSKIVSEKVQKILQNAAKNTSNALSASQQQSNNTQQLKNQSFTNQKLQGSQVILVPKVQLSATPQQNENKQAAAKKPQLQIQKENSAQNVNVIIPSENLLKYYVGGGNNSERIRKLMNKREGWVESKDPTSMFVNFKWQQTTRGYKYEKLIENNNYKQVVNHFEFHKEITNKQYLIKNLMSFAESMKQNVFDITPLTYVIDFNDENCDLILNNFLKFFEMNMPINIKKKQTNMMSKAGDIRKILRQFQTQYGQQGTEKLYNYFYTRWSLNDTFLDKNNSTYMWILKPTFLNRGRGIHVFNSLNSLEKLMNDYTEGFEEKSLKKQEKKEDEIEKVEGQESSIRESQNFLKMTQSQPNITIEESIKVNTLVDDMLESTNLNKDNNQKISQSQSMQKLPSPERQIEVEEEKDNEDKNNENSKLAEKENQLNQGEINSPEIKKVNYNGNFQIKKVNKPVYNNKPNIIPTQKSMTISNISTVASNNTASISQSIAVNNQQKIKQFDKVKGDPKNYIRVVPSGPCILKASQFVVQKYIEKPLLINKRKFDIRVWALVTHNLDVYFFREGYMRLSSSEFSTDEKQLDNLFIHLTNNAIQKYSDNYGQYENGNMWSFQKLWEFLETNYQNQNDSPSSGAAQTEQERKPQKYYKKRIVSKIKDIIWLTFCSIKKKLNQNDRKFCFEMFGFDFLIDEELNSWLIEVNTNPAIDECSSLLKTLIPRALDDALKLTVDQIFTKKTGANNNYKLQKSPVLQAQKQNNIEFENEKKVQDQILEKPVEQEDEEEDHDQETIENKLGSNDQFDLNSPTNLQGESSPTQIITDQPVVQEPEFYTVPGYEDNFNMWELLGNLKDSSNVQAKKKFKQMK